MEQDINIKNTEIVEDMPDFGEGTTETDTEVKETEETPQDEPEKADTETKPDDKSYYKFNPLQMAIRPFYEQAIAEDELFARCVREKESRAEKPKSLAECAEYILGEAYHYASEHRSGSFGFAGMPDADMPGLIRHYYQEDDIVIRKMGAGVKAQVSVSKPKAKKPERPKETMTPGLTKMIRPETKREAKRESKKQADNVIQMDIFSMLGDTEE